jgi:hypothetical protein
VDEEPEAGHAEDFHFLAVVEEEVRHEEARQRGNSKERGRVLGRRSKQRQRSLRREGNDWM